MIKDKPLSTDLIGDKTLKTDEKIEFFGQADELSALIMEFTHYIKDQALINNLRKTVNLLSVMMGEVAGGYGHIGELHVNELTELANEYQEKTGGFTSFCLPGETLLGAKAHVLRTVTRRVERSYARVYEKYGGSNYIFEYLNKLSTFFFAIAKIYDCENN